MEDLVKISKHLNLDLKEEDISIIVEMLNNNVAPESIANIIEKITKEKNTKCNKNQQL